MMGTYILLKFLGMAVIFLLFGVFVAVYQAVRHVLHSSASNNS